MCVCGRRYPAGTAHAPYCHLWPVRLYSIFTHYLINGTILEKKVIDHKMWVLVPSTTFIWNFSHSKKNWARYDKNVYWCSCNVPVSLVRFKRNFNVLDRFSKNTHIPNCIKICPTEAELFHDDGQTGMKLIATFRNFVKAPNWLHCTKFTHGSSFRLAIIVGQLPPRVWADEWVGYMNTINQATGSGNL
jgi:hypothetical protein